jgi:phosphoglycerol transferase MdoB-like AlkP superfamily enzyme
MDDYPNKGDYDGTWGIWDEPYFHFFLRETSKLPEPFLATIFTLSSHHPYVLPPGIKSNPKLNEVENTFSYLDFSLKSYFSEAQKQSWYQQSIFIILSDHSTPTADPIFGTAIGSYRIPLLVFDPQNPNPNVQKQLAQQIDILPLMAKFVGYTEPILSFGKDPEDLTKSWAYNFQSGNFRFITDSLWYISDNNMELKEIFDAKKGKKCKSS